MKARRGRVGLAAGDRSFRSDERPVADTSRPPRDRIRVVRLFSRLNVGGPARHVILACEGLDPERYDSRLVVGREEPREGSLLDEARRRGVAVRVVPSLGRSVRPHRDLACLVELVRLFRRERPDIVHTHTAKAGALGRLAARLTRVPVVVHTYHGTVFRGYFGRLGAAAVRGVEKALAATTDRLVAVSPRVAAELVELGIAPPERIAVVPLGLELDGVAGARRRRGGLRRELGLPPRAPLVGFVGRLVPIKDVGTLLRAMVTVRSRVADALLLVAGDGCARAALEAEARALGLSEAVRFLGFRDDLERLYADVDLVVNASRNEGTPVSLIEAMAAGVPVVATSVGGTPDLLDGGRLGLLVPPRDPVRLADAMIEALTRTEEVEAMRRRARAVVVETYRVERLLADLDRLYTELLTGRARRVAEGRGRPFSQASFRP